MTLTSAASVAFYVLFFVLLGFLSYLGFYKKNKICAILAILLPVLVSGFRFDVGTDYAAYSKMYAEITTEPFERVISRFESMGSEPFILLLIVLCGNVVFGHWLFFTVFSLITVLFLYLSFKKFDEKKAWILFIAGMLILYPLSFNAMRQVAAIAVSSYTLMSIVFDKTKNYWKYILLTIFSITLHYSTLLFAPILLVPLILKKVNYKKFGMAILVLLAITIAVLPSLLGLLLEYNILPQKYADTLLEYESAAISFDLIIICVIAIITFITRGHFNSYGKVANKTMMTMMVCAIFYAGLGFVSAYIGRMADFFWPMNIISLWLICDRFKDRTITRYALFLLIPILYAVCSYIIIGNSQIIPYRVLL